MLAFIGLHAQVGPVVSGGNATGQNGRLLLHHELDGTITPIPMQDLPPATYLLKVFDKKTEIKTFKIIKQ